MASGTSETELFLVIMMVIIAVAVILALLSRSVIVINPWERAHVLVLGKYGRALDPGLSIVPPLVSRVIRVDMRAHHLDVPHQELVTKDHVPVVVDVTVVLKVVDPYKAVFSVKDHKVATADAALSLLRTTIGGLTLEEALEVRPTIIELFTEALDKATNDWGVKVEKMEVRRIDPGDAVMAAYRTEAAAAKEMRAAVMMADAHMHEVTTGAPATGDRDAEIEIAREALDFLPSGLPESLWGWEANELAKAIVDGEKGSTPQGTPLVKIRDRWYVNDPRDMAIHLNEWHKDPEGPSTSDRKGLWK